MMILCVYKCIRLIAPRTRSSMEIITCQQNNYNIVRLSRHHGVLERLVCVLITKIVDECAVDVLNRNLTTRHKCLQSNLILNIISISGANQSIASHFSLQLLPVSFIDAILVYSHI